MTKMAEASLLTAKESGRMLRGLRKLYPDAECELRFENPLELLVATILSAQSTDQRVNQVTEELFRKYRTAADYAAADPEVFEQEIRSTGFYRNKTKLVLGAAKRIVEAYGGEVPETMEELVTLPGVARKTANLVLGTAFGKPEGVVVDTHVTRLSYRLGLSRQKNPDKIERDLMNAFRSRTGSSSATLSSCTGDGSARRRSRCAASVASPPSVRGTGSRRRSLRARCRGLSSGGTGWSARSSGLPPPARCRRRRPRGPWRSPGARSFR